MSYEYLQEVINDYEKLFENEKGYDVIIYVGENENIKEIRAHSFILSTRSQYFCAALSNEWVKKENGKFIFKKPNVSPQLFKIILRFIYCGKIDLKNLRVIEILKLLIAVDELNIQTLISYIQKYLIKNEKNFLQQNFIEIFEMIYQHESLTNLWDFFLEKIENICEKPEILFNSDKFINLKPPLLELILKRDDLSLDEIDIWNNLLKWGLGQNPSISQDSTKWNKEEITAMEKTLHRFITSVRFYHMSQKDFFDKVHVYPLKELLPNDLISNIFKFHVLPSGIYVQPPRHRKQREHFAIFASWIDKKGTYYNVDNIPYKFNLLYRASRDGNTAANFHAKCDNKGATIVVAKIKNSDHMLGGYNPLFWDSSDSYMYTKNSFIFSFKNRNKLQTATVGYSYGKDSICCNKFCGPTFGSGYDLSFQYNFKNINYSVSRSSYSYPGIDIPAACHKLGRYYRAFDVEDYEVFQVIKK